MSKQLLILQHRDLEWLLTPSPNDPKSNWFQRNSVSNPNWPRRWSVVHSYCAAVQVSQTSWQNKFYETRGFFQFSWIINLPVDLGVTNYSVSEVCLTFCSSLCSVLEKSSDKGPFWNTSTPIESVFESETASRATNPNPNPFVLFRQHELT